MNTLSPQQSRKHPVPRLALTVNFCDSTAAGRGISLENSNFSQGYLLRGDLSPGDQLVRDICPIGAAPHPRLTVQDGVAVATAQLDCRPRGAKSGQFLRADGDDVLTLGAPLRYLRLNLRRRLAAAVIATSNP